MANQQNERTNIAIQENFKECIIVKSSEKINELIEVLKD